MSYVGVDIGGTKTLVARLDEHGVIKAQERFATPKNYGEFLKQLADSAAKLTTKDVNGSVVAVPGRLDRKKGLVLGFGTLPWKPAPIRNDIQDLVHCPVVIENDAKLAGLSEALLVKNEFNNVLYVTFGTGISAAVVKDGVLDPAMADSEGGQIWLDYQGKQVQWEDIASGRAIVKQFGKRADEIQDKKTWELIAHNIAMGLIDLIVMVEPQVVILGGGVSTSFEHFIKPLLQILKRYETPLTPIPPLRKAARPEEAVIYGCYELAKITYGSP